VCITMQRAIKKNDAILVHVLFSRGFIARQLADSAIFIYHFLAVRLSVSGMSVRPSHCGRPTVCTNAHVVHL